MVDKCKNAYVLKVNIFQRNYRRALLIINKFLKNIILIEFK